MEAFVAIKGKLGKTPVLAYLNLKAVHVIQERYIFKRFGCSAATGRYTSNLSTIN